MLLQTLKPRPLTCPSWFNGRQALPDVIEGPADRNFKSDLRFHQVTRKTKVNRLRKWRSITEKNRTSFWDWFYLNLQYRFQHFFGVFWKSNLKINLIFCFFPFSRTNQCDNFGQYVAVRHVPSDRLSSPSFSVKPEGKYHLPSSFSPSYTLLQKEWMWRVNSQWTYRSGKRKDCRSRQHKKSNTAVQTNLYQSTWFDRKWQHSCECSRFLATSFSVSS